MIAAVVLAAGHSRRIGAPKVLLPLGDQPVIVHIVEALQQSPVDETIVVTGENQTAIQTTLADRRAQYVRNPDPAGDMLSSVRCGLRALPASCEAVFVLLGDQPSVSAHLLSEMVRAFQSSRRSIVVPVWNGQRGHPLLFAVRHGTQILTDFDDTGLRGLLQAHPEEVIEISASSPSVLEDMDTPADYAREQARHNHSKV